MIETPTLIVMAKAPRLGAGKSRLAGEIGRAEAWSINRTLHAHTLRMARDPRWRVLLCVTPDRDAGLVLPGVWPSHISRMRQGRGDLGARLARALHGRRNIAVIGTDCPALRRSHIASAFAALKRTPFALGPATDGGFWLLAARDGALAAKAMAGVRWSTRHTASDVIAHLGVRNVKLLPTLRDVDVLADLRAYRSATRASSGV